MRLRTIVDGVLVLVAVVALGFAVVLATAPSALPPAIGEEIATVEEAVDPEYVLLGVGVVVGLFALWRSYFSGATDVRDGGVDRERTSPSATDVAVIGERTTRRADATIDALERGTRADPDRITRELRDAARAVERARGHSSERAAERVRNGEWTDDQIAATFLGDDSAGRLSLWHRLRRWLFPGRTFERRLERTLATLEDHAHRRETTADRDGTRTSADDDETETTAADDETETTATDDETGTAAPEDESNGTSDRRTDAEVTNA